jgi:hypothetical protein
MLGRVGSKWPDEGVAPRPVKAVEVVKSKDITRPLWIVAWVTPKADKTSRAQHRAMCTCPGCHKDFSVGRLEQHDCHGTEEVTYA